MTSGPKNPPGDTEAAGGPPTRSWTQTRLESLTGSQVKALLLVASDSDPQPAPPDEKAAEIGRLLAEMSRAPSSANLLETAANGTTSVQELTRIKELAKGLMKDAADGPYREAAQLLYHVAVAAAFVHHAASISGRPMHKQQVLYERFAATWAGHTIGQLFREAVARVAATNRSE